MRGRKAKSERPRVAVAYCRVSTREQAEHGSSLTAQENRLRSLAEAQGHALARFLVDDGYSAGTLRRPAMQQALAAIESGEVSTLYVAKLDRLCRNLADLLAIVKLCEKQDVALVSASENIDTGSPAGRMMLSMLGAFAEFEKARISERIKDVFADRRERRKVYSGAVPFGYRRDRDSLTENDTEQSALATMREMHENGASYRQIAAWLNDRCVPSKGRTWYASSVKAVLESRMHRASLGPLAEP